MSIKMAHICIVTPDLAATQRFYTEGLGFRKVFDFIRGGGKIGFYLEIADRVFIEVFRQDKIDTAASAAILHFCLQVDDIDAVSQALTSKGYEVTEKMLGADHSWQAWSTDPGGVRIEFHQYTDDSCQLSGKDCAL